MGADTKALRTRIKSVDSTLHLTKAMGLVASSKIRKANDAMLKGRQYVKSLEEILSRLTSNTECKKSPYMRQSSGKTRLVVIAGDRGLAGGYNANIFRLMRDYPDAEVTAIGKRACERFGGKFISSEKINAGECYCLSKTLCEDFKNGAYSKLGIVSTKYNSMMSQEAFVKWLLPLSVDGTEKGNTAIFEPNEAEIFECAVPEYVAGVISSCAKESFASEVAARRVAMDSAGKNANQMITDLTLEYNRARQGAITQEITEIVAGSGN